MLSPAAPFSAPSFQPQLKSDYFFSDSSSPVLASTPEDKQPLQQNHSRHSTQQRYYYTEDDDEQEEGGGVTFNISSNPSNSKSNHDSPGAATTSLPFSWRNEPKQTTNTSSIHTHTQMHTHTARSAPNNSGQTFMVDDLTHCTDHFIPQPKPVRADTVVTYNTRDSRESQQQQQQQQVVVPSSSPYDSLPSSVPVSPPFRPVSGQEGAVEYVGPFVLGPVLGRGCTGTVRLGTHRTTNFEVAFKIIDKKYLNSDPKLWKKVKREIAILKLIEHPHVLKLYDVLETEHRLYLVLEHVKGGELFDYIVSKGRLDREESLRLTAQIVLGLEHCHKHRICHRDLKPENLLLDEKMNIKIADFGMAQLMKNNSILKTSCGSPHYASPEIIEGQTYDAKVTDVWSIGVILYALITGSLPFDHDNIPTLLSMVTKGYYTTPAHVPYDVSQLIARMLTVDPKKRIKLSEIRKHPCYKGTTHFTSMKSSSWPYNQPQYRRSDKHKAKHSMDIERRDGLARDNSTNSCSSDDELTADSSDSEEDEQTVDDSVLTDLEALGLGFNREELKQKIQQRSPPTSTSSDKSEDSPEQNIERMFYRLLKKRRNSRLEQLSLLSPKISPPQSSRHLQYHPFQLGNNQQLGMEGSTFFLRSHSEPDQYHTSSAAATPASAPYDHQTTHPPTTISAPSSRATSATKPGHHGGTADITVGMGEWVHPISVHPSISVATTESDPDASTSSDASSESARIPISPFALDDTQTGQEDYPVYHHVPHISRLHSEPMPHHMANTDNVTSSAHASTQVLLDSRVDDDDDQLSSLSSRVPQRKTSASEYYSQLVALTSPSSPVRDAHAYTSINSAPSSPIWTNSQNKFSSSLPNEATIRAAVNQQQSINPFDLSQETDTGRRGSQRPATAVGRRASASAATSTQAGQRGNQVMGSGARPSTADHVARRLFLTEEKEEVDYTASEDAESQASSSSSTSTASRVRSPHQRTKSVGEVDDTPSRQSQGTVDNERGEYTTTPRFHRVRFNPSSAKSPTAALLSPTSPTHSSGSGDSPPDHALPSPSGSKKKSWFSSIFSRRPSLDFLSKAAAAAKKKAQTDSQQHQNQQKVQSSQAHQQSSVSQSSSSSSNKPVSGVYSSKTTLTIADEIRRALKATGMRYVVKKGNANGASLFECEFTVGDNANIPEQQRAPPQSTADEAAADAKRSFLRLARRNSTTAVMDTGFSQNKGNPRRGSLGVSILNNTTDNTRTQQQEGSSSSSGISQATTSTSSGRSVSSASGSQSARHPVRPSSPVKRRNPPLSLPVPSAPRHQHNTGIASASFGPSRTRPASPAPEVILDETKTNRAQTQQQQNQLQNSSQHNRYNLKSSPPTPTGLHSGTVQRAINAQQQQIIAAAQAAAMSNVLGASTRPRANSSDAEATAVSSSSPQTTSPTMTTSTLSHHHHQQPPAPVKMVIEISSHHTNDLRCVRFLYQSGDETLYRILYHQLQQHLHL